MFNNSIQFVANKYTFIKIFLLVTISIFLISCFEIENKDEIEEALERVEAACKNENINTLEEVREVIKNNGNGLSTACRDSFAQIPSPDLQTQFSSVELEQSEIYVLDWDKNSSEVVIAASENGAVNSQIANNVQVNGVDANGAETSLSVNVSSINLDASVTYIQDYSGSMTDDDIELASRYQGDFDSILTTNSFRQVIRFNAQVFDVTNGFIQNDNDVDTALAKDSTIVRGATALYDSWGKAIDDLNIQNQNIRLVVLSTDGLENSSTNYTKSTLKSLVDNSTVYSIVLASSFADKSGLQEVMGDKGVLIYTYKISALEDKFKQLIAILNAPVKVEINDDISSYQHIKITINGTVKTFDI